MSGPFQRLDDGFPYQSEVACFLRPRSASGAIYGTYLVVRLRLRLPQQLPSCLPSWLNSAQHSPARDVAAAVRAAAAGDAPSPPRTSHPAPKTSACAERTISRIRPTRNRRPSLTQPVWTGSFPVVYRTRGSKPSRLFGTRWCSHLPGAGCVCSDIVTSRNPESPSYCSNLLPKPPAYSEAPLFGTVGSCAPSLGFVGGLAYPGSWLAKRAEGTYKRG